MLGGDDWPYRGLKLLDLLKLRKNSILLLTFTLPDLGKKAKIVIQGLSTFPLFLNSNPIPNLLKTPNPLGSEMIV